MEIRRIRKLKRLKLFAKFRIRNIIFINFNFYMKNKKLLKNQSFIFLGCFFITWSIYYKVLGDYCLPEVWEKEENFLSSLITIGLGRSRFLIKSFAILSSCLRTFGLSSLSFHISGLRVSFILKLSKSGISKTFV